MKRAGAKNDGAWFRTNKALQNLDPGAKAALEVILLSDEYINDAWNALVALQTETGTALPQDVQTAADWVTRLLDQGIPRQVWNGRLTFTTYAPVNGTYVANYQSAFHYFAKSLRRKLRNFMFAQREIDDLTSAGAGGSRESGNPSGDPDANKDT